MRLAALLLLPSVAFAAPPHETTLGPAEVTVSANSELAGKEGRPYSVAHLSDADPSTAWVEGLPGTGAGSELRWEFAGPQRLEGFLVWPGYGKSAAVYTKNATPLNVVLTLGSKTRPLRLRQAVRMSEDEFAKTPGGQEGMACVHRDSPSGRAARVVMFSTPETAQSVRLTVDSVIPGVSWKDMPISEARPLLPAAPDRLPGVDAARRFLRSVRDNTPLQRAPGTVLDVRAHPDGALRAELVTARSWGLERPDPPAILEGSASESERASAASAYLAAMRPHLLDVPVIVRGDATGAWLIGTMTGQWGDGEWLEQSPAIRIDAEGRATALIETQYSDGSPGCHDVAPELPGEGGVRL